MKCCILHPMNQSWFCWRKYNLSSITFESKWVPEPLTSDQAQLFDYLTWYIACCMLKPTPWNSSPSELLKHPPSSPDRRLLFWSTQKRFKGSPFYQWPRSESCGVNLVVTSHQWQTFLRTYITLWTVDGLSVEKRVGGGYFHYWYYCAYTLSLYCKPAN